MIVRHLQVRDSNPERWLERWLTKTFGSQWQFESASLRHLRASRACVAIGPQAIPAIVGFLTYDDYLRYVVVGHAIFDMGESAVPYLLDALSHRDVEVRLEVVRTLGLLRADAVGAVAKLVNILSDESPKMQEAAALALGQIKSNPDLSVPALAKALDDPTVSVRLESINALTAFGLAAHSSAPALIGAALCDDDLRVRDFARSAIIHVTSSLDQIRAAGNK